MLFPLLFSHVFPLVVPALEQSRRMVGGDCLMTFPFLAGTEPNFLNFGKVTKRKKRSINSGDPEWQKKKKRSLGVLVCLGLFFFSQRSKRGQGKGNP